MQNNITHTTAVTHNGQAIASEDTQKSHFTVSTILTIVIVSMVSIILVANIIYYYLDYSNMNKRFDTIDTNIKAITPDSSITPNGGEEEFPYVINGTTNPTPTGYIGNENDTNKVSTNVTIINGSNNRAGIIKINLPIGYNADAGKILATINFNSTKKFTSNDYKPVIVVSQLSLENRTTSDLTNKISLFNCNNEKFDIHTEDVINTVSGSAKNINIAYQVFWIKS